jgi:hypothetical protein
MAFTTKQKKQGAVVTAAVGVLALGGGALWSLGSTFSPADSKPIAAAAVPQSAAVPQPAAAPKAAAGGPGSSGSALTTTTGITVTAAADNSTLTDDTVFTVSGEVTGAKPGTKLRLQRQQTPTSGRSSTAWSTLAYTTFTDNDGKFSFPVKMESSGSFTLRVLHPEDSEGPQTASSSPFTVTVSATKPDSATPSKTTSTKKSTPAKTGASRKN